MRKVTFQSVLVQGCRVHPGWSLNTDVPFWPGLLQIT